MLKKPIEEVLEEYKPLVVSIARRYFLAGADFEDLIQEGMIGLYKAVQSFDENAQASFMTFANLCINRQIQSAIKHANTDKNKVLNELTISGDDIEEKMNLIVSLEPNPEDKFISQQNMEYINNEIAKNLSQFERQVLNYYIEGLKYDDIALKLNVTRKTIDKTLVKIRKKLTFLLKLDI